MDSGLKPDRLVGTEGGARNVRKIYTQKNLHSNAAPIALQEWVVHLKKSLPKKGLNARNGKGFTVFGLPNTDLNLI